MIKMLPVALRYKCRNCEEREGFWCKIYDREITSELLQRCVFKAGKVPKRMRI